MSVSSRERETEMQGAVRRSLVCLVHVNWRCDDDTTTNIYATNFSEFGT